MPRKLTRLKIEEVSAVDQAANKHAQIVLRKRDPGAVFRKIFGVPAPGDELRASLTKAAASLPKPKDLADEEADDVHEGDDGEVDDDETVAEKKHLVEVLVPLLVEGSNGGFTRQSALHHLLFHPRGAELVRRLQKQKLQKQKETQAMTYDRSAELTSIIKQFGPVALAKHLVENGPSGLSEIEFTSMTDTWARANNTTFVKLFTAQNSDGLALRRAVQVLKGFGTARPPREAVAGGSAYDALVAKAEALRKQDSSLSSEQAFAKVFVDPANRDLARAERAANRPA
jgi:hypothetical protein